MSRRGKTDVVYKVPKKHLKADFPLIDEHVDLETTTMYILDILICNCLLPIWKSGHGNRCPSLGVDG